MNSKFVGVSVLLCILSMCFEDVQAQSYDDELHIFGFSQVLFNARHTDLTLFESASIPLTINTKNNANSFALHQVNLFFQKSINENATFFLNIEATGSYSSKIPSGNFEIPEGWISFRLTDQMELKTGLLLPRFNNLNEIQNRLPLFPYMIRPIVYENYFVNIFDSEDYLPSNAYFQLSGFKIISKKLTFDYVFYIGNAEDSFLSSVPAGEIGTEEETTALYQGENLNTQLLYGSRIGIENRLKSIKLGASFTYDEDNKTASRNAKVLIQELKIPNLGEIPRYRLGLDASFTYKKWVSETEFIGVFHNLNKVHKIEAYKQANLNKFFFYSNLTYNVTEKMYVFGFTSTLRDKQNLFLAANPPIDYYVNSFGGGWKINDVTVFKVQTMFSKVGNNDFLDVKLRFISLGISTIF